MLLECLPFSEIVELLLQQTQKLFTHTTYFPPTAISALRSAPLVSTLCHNCQPCITKCTYTTTVRAFQHHFAEKY